MCNRVMPLEIRIFEDIHTKLKVISDKEQTQPYVLAIMSRSLFLSEDIDYSFDFSLEPAVKDTL